MFPGKCFTCPAVLSIDHGRQGIALLHRTHSTANGEGRAREDRHNGERCRATPGALRLLREIVRLVDGPGAASPPWRDRPCGSLRSQCSRLS